MTKLFAAAAAALLATAASAQTVTVSYAGLDLASAAGAKTFDARVRSAARAVCGSPDIRDLHAKIAADRCVDATVAGAKAPQARTTA